MMAIVCLAALDATLLAFAFGQPSSATLWFAPLHLAATLLSMRLAYTYLDRATGWQSLALPISVASGPCGIAILVTFQISTDKGDVADERQLHLVEPAKPGAAGAGSRSVDVAKLLDARVRFPAADEVQSLATILRHGSLPARQAALAAAIRSFEPRLSPLIATALADEDQTIRALAAAACTQIGNNLAQRLADFADSGASSVDNELEFGTLLLDHAEYNLLLPVSRRAQLRDLASEIFERSLTAVPRHDHSILTPQERLVGPKKRAFVGVRGKLPLHVAG